MRCFSLFALASATIFGTSSAYVDAGDRTTVTVSANAYDDRTSGYGCSPSGCIAENTRDGSTIANSRWSCKEELENENCKITFEFDTAQDIVAMKIAFHNGDQYTRKLQVELNGSSNWGTIESSGTSNSYQTFTLDTDETESLTLESVDLDSDEWLSIKEVEFLVL